MFKLCPEDSVKRLDEAAALLHRYRFALFTERDCLVQRAYKIVAGLSFDIALCNLSKPEDVCVTGK